LLLPVEYASGARMASCGLDSRCGTSGSTSAVVTATLSASVAVTVMSTPSRMRGLGADCVAAVSAVTTAAASSGAPLWNVTFGRMSKFQVRSSTRFQVVASPGSASPRSSRTINVSAVDQRDSLKASSLNWDNPERGGCSIATRTRFSPSSEEAELDEKHPVSVSVPTAASAPMRNMLLINVTPDCVT
jgi:hypothetical protein